VLYVLVTGIGWQMLPSGFPSYKTVQRWLKGGCNTVLFAGRGGNWPSAMKRCRGATGMKGGSMAPRSPQKRGAQPGPRPVDRGKCGTALHLVCDARAMPLGVVVTGANANEGGQTEDVLQALVVHPPPAEAPVPCLDPRALPRAQADGAYGNGPTQERAWRAGLRLQAPKRSKAQPGVGQIRNAVERCHNFFAQFGRVFHRFDRSARRYLGWLELAACIILLRSGFVS
jgi:transposase